MGYRDYFKGPFKGLSSGSIAPFRTKNQTVLAAGTTKRFWWLPKIGDPNIVP